MKSKKILGESTDINFTEEMNALIQRKKAENKLLQKMLIQINNQSENLGDQSDKKRNIKMKFIQLFIH